VVVEQRPDPGQCLKTQDSLVGAPGADGRGLLLEPPVGSEGLSGGGGGRGGAAMNEDCCWSLQ
jgi:hypothetical protein